MKVCNKIIAFILAFAIAFSLVVAYPVTAHASVSGSVLTDSVSVTAWNSYFDTKYILGSATSVESISITVSIAKSKLWANFDKALADSGLGSMESLEKIQNAASVFGKRLKVHDSSLFSSAYTVLLGRPVPTATVAYDSSLGVYRLRDDFSGLWLVNSAGHFPYYRPETVDDTTGTETFRTGTWVNMQKVGTQTVLWHIASNYELNEFKEQWADLYPNAKIMETTNYYWLVRSDRYTSYVLCDKYGYPYYLPKDGKTAVSTPNNYYQDTTNQYLEENTTNNYYDYENNEYNEYDNSTNVNVMDGGSALVGSPIDINNGIINVGGELQYIDSVTYDASTQTYWVDAHEEYTYNSTTNNYTTNYNLYKYEFHINYTSITYIGQTEEYDERYEMYYQLPDGRSSADLTAEDLEQLSIVFADVVQYARSADDANMRALYHFDGNTEDSSYWSYITTFDWSKGASLTYMDEGTFNGSLYLDETEHEFTINLPNKSDLSADFTIQFRYYQSHTQVDAIDSHILLSGKAIVYFDGSQFLDALLNEISDIPIGTWNEICILRSSGVLYLYLNGVPFYSVEDSTVYDAGTITFHFGSDQQTYKKIDELRITRGAVYVAGENYTPTNVPHDTNLSLILPDGDRPIADETMVIVPSENNLLTGLGLSDWTTEIDSSSLIARGQSYFSSASYWNSVKSGPKLSYNSSYTSFDVGSEFTTMTVTNTSARLLSGTASGYNNHYYYQGGGLYLPVTAVQTANNSTSGVYSSFGSVGDVYTFSVVLSDGTYSYVNFTLQSAGSFVRSFVNCSGITLSYTELYYRTWAQDQWYNWLSSGITVRGISIIPSSGSCDIVYMELVKGSAPEFTLTWEQAMYSSGELEDSPVLAVRTNQTITGYQIGGVRPSYPTKGLVYAMVENSRIISLQQYSGSAWVEVDGRIWTGERWIPYSSFDVFTLQDCYDIIGGSDDDYEYIYTESGFWSWLQKAWSKMLQKLDAIIIALGGDPDALPGDSSGSDQDKPFWQRVKGIFENALADILEGLLELITNVLDLVLGVVYDLLDFFFDLLTDAVTNGIGGFFDALMDETLLQFFQSEEPVLDEYGQPVLDENGDPVTVSVVALPSGVAAVFAFISAAFMLLPDELRFVLLFGLGTMFLFAVLKLVRS